jgi:hypothetical protein
VFENKQSAVFGSKWLQCLDSAGVESLHMQEAMRCGDQFRVFRGRETGRDNLLRELAAIAATSNPKPLLIAAPMSTTEFRALPQLDQERLKNPVYCGFEACVREMVKSIPRTEAHSLQIAVDLAENYSPEILKLFIKLRKENNEIKQRCHVIFFGDDRFIPILQIADMYAYCCRAYSAGNPHPVILDLIEILTGSRTMEANAKMVYTSGNMDLGSGVLDT